MRIEQANPLLMAADNTINQAWMCIYACYSSGVATANLGVKLQQGQLKKIQKELMPLPKHSPEELAKVCDDSCHTAGGRG